MLCSLLCFPPRQFLRTLGALKETLTLKCCVRSSRRAVSPDQTAAVCSHQLFFFFFLFPFDLCSTLNVENPRHDVDFNELIRVEHLQEQPAVECEALNGYRMCSKWLIMSRSDMPVICNLQ